MGSEEKADILIVDDDPAKLMAMEAVLADLGHNLIKAQTGAEALMQCLDHDFAVILLDVRMPGMDGFETASLIRQRRRSERTPIIFVTSYSRTEVDMIKGYATGAVDYMFTPVVPEILHGKVAVFVDLFQKTEEVRRQKERIEAASELLEGHMAEIERLNRGLEATNGELEAFSYSVSHDLRAPLNHIEGFSKILQDEYRGNLDEQGQGYIARIRDAVQRMGQLIEDLLKLSRVARAEMVREQVDLSKLAEDAVRNLRQAGPERQVEVVISPDVIGEGDANLLRIVIENLIGNAWKYTSKHPEARIEFGATRHDGQPACFVRDDGIGFDMTQATKIFAPFQRLHSADQYPGTGIGLATVARIVHRHGGQVWAESEPGKGATFYFTLKGALR